MNAINAVKAELNNSNDIEAMEDGRFVVWDEYGSIISNYNTKTEAVDALFSHAYGV